MMSSFARFMGLSIFVVAGCLVFQGDGDTDDGVIGHSVTPEIPLPIGTGRSFTFQANFGDEEIEREVSPDVAWTAAWLDSATGPSGIDPAGADHDWNVFRSVLESWCLYVTSSRREGIEENDELKDSLEQLQAGICMGNVLSLMAESPSQTDVFVDTHKFNGFGRPDSYNSHSHVSRGENVYIPSLQDFASTGGASSTDFDLLFVVPPQDASGSATLALLASQYFRLAVFKGALTVYRCNRASVDCDFSELLQAGRRDGEEGLSEEDDDEISLAQVFTVNMVEAWHGVRDAVEDSQRLVLAEAHARHSGDGDFQQKTIESWRGIIDSRLEVANLLVGVTPRLFEPNESILVDLADPDGELVTRGLVPAFGDYPVVTIPSQTEADQRAEELLRAARVDPRDEDVVETLYQAIQDDHPDAFDYDVTAETFFESGGISVDTIRRAARRLEQEAAAFGRAIRSDESVSGEEYPGSVERFSGTIPSSFGPPPAYSYALTAGSTRVEDLFSDGPMYDRNVEHGLWSRTPRIGYALRSIYGTLDFAAVALQRLLDRPEMADIEANDSSDAEVIRQSALSFIAEARSEVPTRVDVALWGERTEIFTTQYELLTRVYIRIYGVDEEEATDPDVFELWVGEAGLECATTGRVGTLECDPEDYRISVSANHYTNGESSGHGDSFVYLANSNIVAPPGASETTYPFINLVARGNLYLTRRETNGRRAIAGFDIRPDMFDESDGSWRRYTMFPVGPAIFDALSGLLSPAAGEPTLPDMSCAGLPHDLRLPLEDELMEAAVGSDQIESSFAHYLALARRAADEADRLGEEIIQQGFEMDLRAEAARDRLEQICGEVVNVPRLDTTVEGDCSDASDCAPGTMCVAGSCITGDIDDMMDSDDGTLEQLNQCIGFPADDYIVTASLGSHSLCFYRPLDEGYACECRETDPSMCPACPVSIDASQDCSVGPGGVFEALSETDYSAESTEPLYIVQPETRGAGPADCMALARLRHRLPEAGEDLNRLTESVLSQSWINSATMMRFAQSTSMRLDPDMHTTVLHDGAGWITTGNIYDGVVTDSDGSTAWPCAPLLPETEPEIDALQCNILHNQENIGNSILCGLHGSASSSNCDSICPTESEDYYGAGFPTSFTVQGGIFGDDRCVGRQSVYARLWLALNAARDIVDFPQITNGYVGVGYIEDDSVQYFENQLFNGSVPISDSRLTESYRFIGVPGSLCANGNAAMPYTAQNGTVAWLLRVKTSQNHPTISYGTVYHNSAMWCRDLAEGVRSSCIPFHSELPFASCPTALVSESFEQASPSLADSGALGDNVRTFWNPAGFGSVHDFLRVHQNHEIGLIARPPDDLPNTALNPQSIWDALELTCMHVTERDGGGCLQNSSSLPTVGSTSDFVRLERALLCVADSLEQRASHLMLAEMPRSIVDDVRNGAISPTFPANRGELGESIADLRGSIESVVISLSQIATALREFSYALRIARSQILVSEFEAEIAEQQRLREISSHTAACAAASSVGFNVGVSAGGGGASASFGVSFNPGAAAAICSDATVQNAVSNLIASIRENIEGEEQQMALNHVANSFSTSMDTMAEAARNLSTAYANVNRILAHIDGQRRDASRELARMTFQGQDAVGREFAVNRVMRARMNTLLERYGNARIDAIRMSWIARRAIEQRMGVDLSDLTAEMSLVSAPATWADRICTMSGIDYEEIREGEVTNYSDGYVGDYVTLLENFDALVRTPS